MKSVTITIPEELDREAAAEARRRGISKSELFRRGLASLMGDSSAAQANTKESESENPWYALAGFGSEQVTVAPGDIDAVVYDE